MENSLRNPERFRQYPPVVPRRSRGTRGVLPKPRRMRREFSNTSSPSSCQSHCNRVKNKTIISYYIPVVEIDQFAHFKKQGGIGQFPPYFYRGELVNSPLTFTGGKLVNSLVSEFRMVIVQIVANLSFFFISSLRRLCELTNFCLMTLKSMKISTIGKPKSF